jgi:hypothetical protein
MYNYLSNVFCKTMKIVSHVKFIDLHSFNMDEIVQLTWTYPSTNAIVMHISFCNEEFGYWVQNNHIIININIIV